MKRRAMLITMGLGALASCATMDINVIAPPVVEASPELARGRTIYVTKCAKCHAPEPVAKYSLAKWHEIMPEMAEETKLSPADTAAVMAYVEHTLRR